MPRRRVLRYLKTKEPEPTACQKYFVQYLPAALYHHPEHFPPFTSNALFGNAHPLELEVGCGSGEYLCLLARRFPEHNFVGIDKSRKAIYRGVQMAADMKLANIKFIEADVHLIYPLLVPASLQAVYMHFPDPYERPQLRKRRIFSPKFLEAVSIALREGGILSVASDHEEFFMEMLDMVEQDDRFAKQHAERYLRGFDVEVKSRFQHIWESHGVVPLRFLVYKQHAYTAAGKDESLKGLQRIH
jgi:tRNA (guanine-N7-)-methyltransferase